MKSILITLGVLFGLSCFIFGIIALDFTLTNKKSTAPMISFKTFMNLYSIAPYNWYLCENAPSYQYHDNPIYFDTIFSFIKYKRFINQKKKNSAKEQKNKNTQEMCSLWINDIECYKKRAQSEVEALARKNELERAAAMKKFYDAL